MKKRIDRMPASSRANRPGGVALVCGLILFGMGAYVYQWNQQQIEGPAQDRLVRVDAILLEASCKAKLSSSSGAAHSSRYGVPVVHFVYIYGGQTYSGYRYFRQPGVGLGYMPQCENTLSNMLHLRTVEAWVDPQQPEFAVLSKELGSEFVTNLFMYVGGALVTLGMCRLLKACRKSDNKGDVDDA